jgi:uncharacterized DUF497 family protein
LEAQFWIFEWDELKAAANLQKHGVTFELAASVFYDPQVLTVFDSEHSLSEDRWFSIGAARNGAVLSLAYLWTELEPGLVKVRLISARRSTPKEVARYFEGL